MVADPHSFMSGGGEMGALIRDHDWAGTAFGPADSWPQSLKSVVSAVLNSPMLGAVLWGPELRMFYNDAYIPSMADRHPRALGRPVAEVWGETWEQDAPAFHRAMASGEGFSQTGVELPTIRRGKPEVTYWDFTTAPIRGEDGRIAGLLTQGVEITDQVHAERQLKRTFERQRLLFEQMPGFVGVLSGPTHIYEYVNRAYLAIGGQREFVGRSVREVFPELADQGFYELLDDVYASGERFSALAMPIRLSGENADRYIDLLYQPIRDEGGRVTGIFVGGYDITERVRAEEELRALTATLEKRVEERTAELAERNLERNRLWELSSDIMLRCGFDGRITAVNPAWTEVLGWRNQELVGANLFDLVHPEDAAEALATAKSLSAGTLFSRFDNRYRHKNGGYRCIAWSWRADATSINAVGRDVTTEREQAAALKAAEASLRQAQKMEAVGQLTGGLAHDFNNLLAGISGSLELMQIRARQGRIADLDHYLIAAQGAVKRAAALTHRLLAFSRRQTLDPKVTDVNRLVNGMEELIRRSVGPSIHMEVVGSGGLWLALIDPGQLENALLNLCINSRDAMPDGGRITIETANKWLDEAGARKHGMAPGQYLSICVTDTGGGMSADLISKVFEPFFTTKPLGEGTGLGLSMVYGFARQSGGQVRIYSEVGQGTTVCLYLPRHHGEAEEERDPGAPGDLGGAEQGETVLVVDDEPTVRMLITTVLEDFGYRSIEAADSIAGLRILESDARIDLLVTDVGLPGGMNGRQMADAGRVRRTDLKVLFITGYAENAVFGNGHLTPGMQVLTKPFTLDALAARIRTLIRA